MKNVPTHQMDTNHPFGSLPERDTGESEFVHGHLPITGSMYVQYTCIPFILNKTLPVPRLLKHLEKNENENKNTLKLRQHIREGCFRTKTKCEQGCILSNYRKQRHVFTTKATHTKRIQERRDMRKKWLFLTPHSFNFSSSFNCCIVMVANYQQHWYDHHHHCPVVLKPLSVTNLLCQVQIPKGPTLVQVSIS